MDFLNKLFSKKQSETPSSNATHKKLHEAENITPPETVSQNILRLASPNHPARKQIVEVSDYLNKSVKVESAGGAYLVSNTIDFGVAEKMGVILDEGIALAPDDCDMLVAKAIAVQSYRGGFQETLDMVLSKEPHHFEAKMLNEHGGVWESMLSFPYWDEQQTSLHPLMLSRFNQGTAFQLVRDGLQKTVAIVAGGPPDPLDKHTQVKAKWVLSKTPYGSIVAYYVSIQVPMNKPVNLEMFLASAKPPLFKPTEACFLLQQLAFTPYCFIVLTNQGKVVLNKRMILGTSTIREVRDIAKQVSEQESYIAESQVKSACQWHMNNFDMDHLKFD